MIAPLKTAPKLSQTVVGAKIETLYECYHDVPSLASFFEHEGGAVITLFGGRLTVCGIIPADEILAFADFIGACEVEGICKEIPEIFGFERNLHPIMAYQGCGGGGECRTAPDMLEGYDILAAADHDFAKDCDKWEWLSDMTRRRNCQRGNVYMANGAAVIVTAQNDRELIIGAVASHPDVRKKGAASSLVKGVCAKATAKGLLPVTVAADELAAGFYSRLGFKRTDALALLTRKASV